jgi:hypothetical protein
MSREGAAGFICGGQRGVDLWAAEAGSRLGIPVSLVLPEALAVFCAGWTTADQRRLEATAAAAASLEIVDPEDVLGSLAYDLRNERIAARADRLIAVWTGIRRGGSFHTLCAAREAHCPVEDFRLELTGGQLRSGRGI